MVLYDPWWNPAVEAQAIDRSHRIGQLRTVNAFRLIAPGTVEEKIWELQQRKAQTIADVLGERGFATNLTAVRPAIPLRRGLNAKTPMQKTGIMHNEELNAKTQRRKDAKT